VHFFQFAIKTCLSLLEVDFLIESSSKGAALLTENISFGSSSVLNQPDLLEAADRHPNGLLVDLRWELMDITGNDKSCSSYFRNDLHCRK
jgi:hypothetical protein